MIALLFLLDVDLVLHQVPPAGVAPGLSMRAPTADAKNSKPQTAPQPEPEVHYRLNVGYGVDNARSTGVPAIPDFREVKRTLFRSYAFGDVAFGAHGLPVASLDTYFAAAYYYDFLGADPNSPFTTVHDRGDPGDHPLPLLIRSAYAELDPASQGGAPVFLRAGRQFRMGAGVAHFDGISAGYDDSHVEATGFVGQRVALWVDERTGIVGGGALRARSTVGEHPVEGALEVLTFDGDAYWTATVRSSGVRGQGYVSALLSGPSVSDLIGHAQYYVTRHVTLLADAQQKIADAPLYDWISGREPAAGQRAEFPLRYFTMPEPQPFTQLRMSAALAPISALEFLVEGSGHIVEGSRPESDPWPGRTGFDASWLEAGGMVDWRPGQGLSVLGGYRYRMWDRPAITNEPRLDDPENAGELRSHELLVDFRFSLGPRRLTTTAGGFLRIDDVQTPFLLLQNDIRGGLRFDVESWLVRRVRLKASYEIADPSRILSPDIDTFQSVHMIAEAVF